MGDIEEGKSDASAEGSDAISQVDEHDADTQTVQHLDDLEGGDIEVPEPQAVESLSYRQQQQSPFLETVVEGVPHENIREATTGPWGENDEDEEAQIPENDVETGSDNRKTAPKKTISFGGTSRSGSEDDLDDDELASGIQRNDIAGTHKSSRLRASALRQSVSIRNADMCNAMDQNVRRRHIFRNQIARFFGGKGDDELEDESMRISMHGRLRVQSSKVIKEKESQDDDDDDPLNETTQYKLSAVKTRKSKSNAFSMPSPNVLYEDTINEAEGCCPCGSCPCTTVTADRIATKFLHWSFRSPFIVVFGSAAIGWLALTFMFAFFIWIIGVIQPHCIGGLDFTKTSGKFSDAYAISWTTFSTVGYGLIYPATSSNHAEIHNCTVITMLTAFESFVGVLFASLCGAIMFAKVARVQSFAQATFSDAMVIRYGAGLHVDHGEDDEEDDRGSDGSKGGGREDPTTTHIPCPVLEFRIVNRLNSLQGGEIIDASLNMVASIDAAQSDPTLQASQGRRRKGKKGKKRGPVKTTRSNALRTQAIDPPPPEPEPSKPEESEPVRTQPPPRRPYAAPPGFGNSGRGNSYGGRGRGVGRSQNSFSQRFSSFRFGGDSRRRSGGSQRLGNSTNSLYGSGRSKTYQAFEEDPSGKLIPKKILSKLEIESPDHPFFRRIWLVRHTLDMNSPILKVHVRHMLRRNNGFWPRELNDYESVRDSVEFDQILVSLTGTSNADANSVYAQHVYHKVDVNIGYRFVNALYRDPSDGNLRVDAKLINDVHEQAGGGGEPFRELDGSYFQDMLVL